MEFLLFLLVLALIAVFPQGNCHRRYGKLIAREFSAIAEAKGYDGRRYWHVAFWLGLVGYLIIIGLPDKNTRNAQNLIASRLYDLNETLKTTGNTAQSGAVYTSVDLPEL